MPPEPMPLSGRGGGGEGGRGGGGLRREYTLVGFKRGGKEGGESS